MDEQFVTRGIDRGHAIMMTLEMQTIGRDRALEQMQGRARGAGRLAAWDEAKDALDFIFPFGWPAIAGHHRARTSHPSWRGSPDRVGSFCRSRRRARYCSSRAGGKNAAV